MTTRGAEPAFAHGNPEQGGDAGLSKRELAAINLRIPDSGLAWLDDMIRAARRRDDAAVAMQGLLADGGQALHYHELAPQAVGYADALLAELERGR